MVPSRNTTLEILTLNQTPTIAPAAEINRIQQLQNFPGHTIACSDEELEQAIVVRTLEPIQRLEWLREARIERLTPRIAGGGGGAALLLILKAFLTLT